MWGADGILPHCKRILQLQMANSHSKRQTAKSIIIAIDFSVEIDLSVTGRSARGKRKNVYFHK